MSYDTVSPASGSVADTVPTLEPVDASSATLNEYVDVANSGLASGRMRSMRRSPSAHGLSATVHVSAVVLALSDDRDRVVVPVTSMKSMM